MPAITHIRYTHDAMIDLVIAEPSISQGRLAQHFGYTEPWVSQVVNSDVFQARLAERKSELIDPAIVAAIEERLKGVTTLALNVVEQSLVSRRDPEYALEVLKVSTKALGYGAKVENQTNITSFVVALPSKEPDAAKWLEKFAPTYDAVPVASS